MAAAAGADLEAFPASSAFLTGQGYTGNLYETRPDSDFARAVASDDPSKLDLCFEHGCRRGRVTIERVPELRGPLLEFVGTIRHPPRKRWRRDLWLRVLERKCTSRSLYVGRRRARIESLKFLMNATRGEGKGRDSREELAPLSRLAAHTFEFSLPTSTSLVVRRRPFHAETRHCAQLDGWQSALTCRVPPRGVVGGSFSTHSRQNAQRSSRAF